jgi:tetratricopeptide (TPR) repeat protein
MTALRVFISSPGDVAQERAIARRVLGRVQGAYRGRLRLEPLVWEQQPLVASVTFQAQLQPPSSADIVVAVLWSRLGTPLPSTITRSDGSTYRSGSEFEIEDALTAARRDGRPKVLLYRKTAEPSRWFVDPADALAAADQRSLLHDFLDRLLRDDRDGSFRGAFHPFRSPAEFEDLLEQHLHRLLAELAPDAVAGTEVAATGWSFGSPFRGLLSFELEHSALFFGRTAATAAAIERLLERARRGAAFLLLLGMSGGGKSSLAKAGVLPMLMQDGVVAGARAWRHAVCTPAEGRGDLVLSLALALIAPGALPNLGTAAALAADLRAAPGSLADRLIEALDGTGEATHLAIVIDQLEEIFSDPAVEPSERTLFVALIDALARSGRAWTIATMRSDYYAHCVELPQLLALKEGDGQFDVQPPTPTELAQMIRMPAAAAGLRFAEHPITGERLDETLRDLTAARPGALPLLEFTLEELYRRRQPDGLLDFAAYAQMGGLEGALAHRAEAVFEAAAPPVQQALPRVFERLVSIGDDEGVLRRRAPLAAFAVAAERELVGAMIESRLLVADLAAAGEGQVSVAHEALFRHWPRLVEWLDNNRELLRVRSRVRAAAERWESEQRREEFLLAGGKPLAEALVLRDADIRLDPSETALIEASEARVRRARNLRRGAIAALALLTLGAVVAALVAVRQADIARREATTASRTSEFLASLFAVADPGESRGNEVTARELLDRGAQQIRSELRDEPLVRAQLLNTMGVAYSGLGLYAPALELTGEAREERRRRLGPGHLDTLRSAIAHANVLAQSGDYARAAGEFREARVRAASLGPTAGLDRVHATLGLAEALTFDGDPAQGEQLFRAALAELDAAPADSRRERVYALSGLGTALYLQSRLDAARRAFAEALELGRKALGEDHPKVAETINNLGSISYQQGDYRAAERQFERALPLYRVIFGDGHPELAIALNNLARVALLARHFAQAEQALEESLAIHRGRRDPMHDDLIIPLNSLGLARMGLGDRRGARAALDEALSIAVAREHWMRGVILTGIADLQLGAGEVDAAADTAADARHALEASFPPATRADEGWRFQVLDSVEGGVRAARGDYAGARAALLGAIDPLAERFGEQSLFAVDAMRRAVDHYYAKSGERTEAAALRRRLQRAQAGPS